MCFTQSKNVNLHLKRTSEKERERERKIFGMLEKKNQRTNGKERDSRGERE